MKTFINVAQMKLASLKEGQFVETGGYYTKGDAGQAKYLIVAAQAADGYGDHTLANGTVAVLQVGAEVNVTQFGAKGDGVFANDGAIQAAFNLGKRTIIPDGIFGVTVPLILKSNNNLVCAGIDKTIIKNISGAPIKVITTGLRVGGTYTEGKKENISIDGLTVDGDVYGTKVDGDQGISFSYCNNIKVTNSKVMNSNGGGIRIDGYGASFEDAAYLEPTTIQDDGLTSTVGLGTVTVFAPRHGLNQGALVTIANVNSFRGLLGSQCEGEFSINIVDESNFSYSTVGTATSSGVGGGTSIDISNGRHSTEWKQSQGFTIENCQTDGVYLGIEIEGGAKGGRIVKNKITNTELHAVRIPSGYDIRVVDNETVGIGSSGYWIDRSAAITCSDNYGSDIQSNAFSLGILTKSSIKDNSIEINDIATKKFLTDSFQRAVGITNCVIKDNRSQGTIELVAGSESVIIKDNACIIDAVRPLNKDVLISDNLGLLEQAGSLNQYSTRFGGEVEVVRAKNLTGGVSRYSVVDGVSLSAFVIFNGTATTIIDSFGVSGVVRNSAGNYTVTFDREYTTSLNGVPSAIFPAVTAVPTAATLGPPSSMTVLAKNAAGTTVDSTLVTLFVIGY